MKTSSVSLLMISCLAGFALLAPGFAATIPAQSAITAVTVYGDRAVVTRSATHDLVRGKQEFEFAELPATLVDQSLQVAGRGEARQARARGDLYGAE